MPKVFWFVRYAASVSLHQFDDLVMAGRAQLSCSQLVDMIAGNERFNTIDNSHHTLYENNWDILAMDAQVVTLHVYPEFIV